MSLLKKKKLLFRISSIFSFYSEIIVNFPFRIRIKDEFTQNWQRSFVTQNSKLWIFVQKKHPTLRENVRICSNSIEFIVTDPTFSSSFPIRKPSIFFLFYLLFVFHFAHIFRKKGTDFLENWTEQNK